MYRGFDPGPGRRCSCRRPGLGSRHQDHLVRLGRRTVRP